ncbi:hypothetical protein FI667_g3617, partial [Globisporangium splendens]
MGVARPSQQMKRAGQRYSQQTASSPYTDVSPPHIIEMGPQFLIKICTNGVQVRVRKVSTLLSSQEEQAYCAISNADDPVKQPGRTTRKTGSIYIETLRLDINPSTTRKTERIRRIQTGENGFEAHDAMSQSSQTFDSLHHSSNGHNRGALFTNMGSGAIGSHLLSSGGAAYRFGSCTA